MLKLRLLIQHLFYDYWDGCWKESHFFQRTEVGINGIGAEKFVFHFCMLYYEITERFLFSCNFGMFLFTSLVYNKGFSVLRGMVSNVLIVSIVWCFHVQLCFQRCDCRKLVGTNYYFFFKQWMVFLYQKFFVNFHW